MTKRIIFLVSIIFSTILIIILLVFRFKAVESKEIIKITEETLIEKQNFALEEEIDEKEEKALIQLESDETYVSSFSSDLNEDGLVDEVIAVKKNVAIFNLPNTSNSKS